VRNSVRVQLTLWYTGILALILVVFASGLYLLLSRRLYGELDAGLRSALEVTSLSLRHEIEEHKGAPAGEAMFATVLKTLHQASFPRQSISVYAGERLVAAKPGAVAPLTPPPQTVFGPEPAFQTIATAAGDQRVGRLRITVPGAPTDYHLLVGEPVDRTLAELGDIRTVLLIAVPCALVLAAAFGYILARKSLEPVVAMSNEVERLTARSLAERLTVVNANDELGQLASTFNRLLARLDQSFDQQRRFMADASHELRTPISVARTAAEVTIDGSARSEEEYREALALIALQMRRLTRVVNDMFTLARADSGAYRVQARSFYLNDVLEEALKAAQQLAKQKRIRVTGSPFPEAPYEGDEDLVRQLVLILLDNAVKYSPEDSVVELRLEPGYRIVVSDSGIGVPPEAVGHIFDRFFRVDKSRSRSAADRSGGAGLGLAIARWIAEVHNGQLELVRSEPGGGSVFAATLPLPAVSSSRPKPGRQPQAQADVAPQKG